MRKTMAGRRVDTPLQCSPRPADASTIATPAGVLSYIELRSSHLYTLFEAPNSSTDKRVPHAADDPGVVRLAENGGTGDEGVGSGCRSSSDVVRIDAAVDLQPDVASAGIDQRTRLGDLAQRLINEGLAAETGVDRHDQHHVDAFHDVFQPAQRRGRIEHQPGPAAAVARQL